MVSSSHSPRTPCSSAESPGTLALRRARPPAAPSWTRAPPDPWSLKTQSALLQPSPWRKPHSAQSSHSSVRNYAQNEPTCAPASHHRVRPAGVVQAAGLVVAVGPFALHQEGPRHVGVTPGLKPGSGLRSCPLTRSLDRTEHHCLSGESRRWDSGGPLRMRKEPVRLPGVAGHEAKENIWSR